MNSHARAFQESLKAALASLWAHRVRSALTTLGIIIGVASVVIVVQLGKSLEARVMEDIDRQTSLTFFLNSWSSQSWKDGRKTRHMDLTTESIQELRRAMPEIQQVSPSYFIWSRRAVFRFGTMTRRVQIQAVDEQHMDLFGYSLAAGRAFTTPDRLLRAQVAVLGDKLIRDMGLEPETAIGRTFTLGGMTAEIIGVLKPKGELPLMPSDDESADWGPDGRAFVPLGAFLALTPSYRPMDDMEWRLQVAPSLSQEEAETRLKTELRRLRGIRAGDADNFEVTSSRKEMDLVGQVSRTLLMASGVMVGISLLVGGIGVMNIMLVSVTERTREIGIRKALGAPRRAIRSQFLIEALLLCLLGGATGLLLGFTTGTVLCRFVMQHLVGIPWWALGAAFFIPALVGLIFGFYPALKASRLDPIEALRYE